MADNENEQAVETVLVAFATVYLDTGESFELLPFEDADDVKRSVTDLLEEWARSGFLARGNEFYPWHRVRRIEATRVLEMTRSEADLLQAKDGTAKAARMQQSFWKTKHPRERKKEDGENGKR